MNRCAFVSAAALALASFAFAPVRRCADRQDQRRPRPASSADAGRAGQVRAASIKGLASVQFIQDEPKIVGKDIVTVLQVKNVSSGPIGLLRIDELWYDGKNQRQISGDTRDRQADSPGEVIDVTIKSPQKPASIRVSTCSRTPTARSIPKRVKKFD